MITSYSIYQNRLGTGSDSGAPTQDTVAASSTNTYYSLPWHAYSDWGLTVITSGTLTGTWTLWATDKNKPDFTSDTDWVDMSATAEFVETNPAGSTTKWRVNSVLLRGGFFRLKYVNASGTGNIEAHVTTRSM